MMMTKEGASPERPLPCSPEVVWNLLSLRRSSSSVDALPASRRIPSLPIPEVPKGSAAWRAWVPRHSMVRPLRSRRPSMALASRRRPRHPPCWQLAVPGQFDDAVEDEVLEEEGKTWTLWNQKDNPDFSAPAALQSGPGFPVPSVHLVRPVAPLIMTSETTMLRGPPTGTQSSLTPVAARGERPSEEPRLRRWASWPSSSTMPPSPVRRTPPSPVGRSSDKRSYPVLYLPPGPTSFWVIPAAMTTTTTTTMTATLTHPGSSTQHQHHDGLYLSAPPLSVRVVSGPAPTPSRDASTSVPTASAPSLPQEDPRDEASSAPPKPPAPHVTKRILPRTKEWIGNAPAAASVTRRGSSPNPTTSPPEDDPNTSRREESTNQEGNSPQQKRRKTLSYGTAISSQHRKGSSQSNRPPAVAKASAVTPEESDMVDPVPSHPSCLLVPNPQRPLDCQMLPRYPHVEDDTLSRLYPILTSELTDRDILLGRGGMTNYHSGNLWFRDLMAHYRVSYCVAAKFDKSQLAQNLCNYVRLRGGRFLQRVGSSDPEDLWYEVGDVRGHAKISQSLREGTAAMVRHTLQENMGRPADRHP